jgi:hypothetical protein
MREQGISQGRLATRLIRQLPEEHYFDAATVGRIIAGKRQIDDELFDCLVDILGMDRAEAYYALGVWPTDLSLADYRQLRERVGARPVSRAAALLDDSTTVTLIDLAAERAHRQRTGRKAA